MGKAERKRAAVMMSSFNGERYLEEQLESILRNTGVDIDLYIRDDGSSDGTTRILQEYSRRDHVFVQYGRHVGLGSSFMELLWSLPDTYDYYSFSDQDDIWEKDKLITAVDRLDAESGCALYASGVKKISASSQSCRIVSQFASRGAVFSSIPA